MGPWRIPLVLAITTFVHYLDRNTLALALPQIAAEHGWSNAETGLYGEWLLGAFYVSFGVVQIFLSPAAERWSPKGSLALSVAGFSVVTLLFWPLGGSLAVLVGLRLLLGAAESVHMPMNSAIIGRVFPPEARSRANSIYVGGILLALGLSPLLLVPLIGQIGWRKVFGLLGAGGLLVSLPWCFGMCPPCDPKPNYPYLLAPGATPSCALHSCWQRQRLLYLWPPKLAAHLPASPSGHPFCGVIRPVICNFLSGHGGLSGVGLGG